MKRLNGNYDYYEHLEINNLEELLHLGFKNYTDNIAFSYTTSDKKIKKTYKEVYNDVINLSKYFNSNFKNKHIALIGENSYNWIITFLAIILSGNVCVVIDKDTLEQELINLLSLSDTKIICYSAFYNPYINKLKYKKIPLDDISEYLKKGKNFQNNYSTLNDKDAVIFFTSGTTGANKAVVLSQKNIAKDIYGASSLYKPNGNVVSILPFHHAFGIITGILMPLYYGVEIYINKSLKYIKEDLKNNKPETLFVVPAFIETFYKQIWKNLRLQKKEKKLKYGIKISNSLLKLNIDLRKKIFKDILNEFGGNLHYIICGGAYLDKKYVKWFRNIGIEILNGYGITECSPVVSVNRNFYYKDGSVGQICRKVKVKIVNDEIFVGGDIVMKGYYKDKKATNAVLKNGYFATGDLGYIDNEGFLYITGRKKNIIILSNGENISPEYIEASLMKNAGIQEVIVCEEANRLIAYIYPTEEYLGNQEYFDNLIYNYNKKRAKNHQIALVKLRTNEFIKNHNGKILRNMIREED